MVELSIQGHEPGTVGLGPYLKVQLERGLHGGGVDASVDELRRIHAGVGALVQACSLRLGGAVSVVHHHYGEPLALGHLIDLVIAAARVDVGQNDVHDDVARLVQRIGQHGADAGLAGSGLVLAPVAQPSVGVIPPDAIEVVQIVVHAEHIHALGGAHHGHLGQVHAVLLDGRLHF